MNESNDVNRALIGGYNKQDIMVLTFVYIDVAKV
jgi:hypothetical protein